MLQIVDLSQIKERADAIGVSLKVLAREAHVDPSAAYRGAAGSDFKKSTALKLLSVLVPREKALLHLLARRYPADALAAARGGAPADARQMDLEDLGA